MNSGANPSDFLPDIFFSFAQKMRRYPGYTRITLCLTLVIEARGRGEIISRDTGARHREAQNRSPDVQTSDFLTRTRKSLGRGSRWQKGTLAGIQNRDVQTSDFLVPGQGSPWAGAAGTGKKGELRGVHRVGGIQGRSE